MKVSIKSITTGWWAYLFFFIALQPAAFQHFSGLSKLYDLVQFALLIIVLYFRFASKTKGKIKREVFYNSKIWVLLVVYYMYLITITYMENGRTNAIIMQGIQFCGFSLYLDTVLKWNPKEIYRSALNILTIYLFLNLVIIFVMPEGLYQTTYFTNNYLLGYDNQNINFILPTMVLVLLKNQCYKSCKIQVIVTYLAAFGIAVKIWSAMTLVVVSCMSIFAFMSLRKRGVFLTRILNGRVFNFFNLLLLNIGMNIGVVFFKIQYYFEYLIVIILKKSLTLTSRVTIWERTIKYIKEKPLWGYGKEIYRNRALRMGYKAEHPAGLHAHNRFLETIYSGGIILLVIYISILFYAAKKLYEVRHSAFAKTLAFGLFIYMCGMITELYDYCIFLWGFLVMAENAKRMIEVHEID